MFTHFPSLHDTINPGEKNAVLSAAWPSNLPRDLLILSWALLLRSYTGDAAPVFSLEGKAIQVDLKLGSWAEVGVNIENAGEHDLRHTCLALSIVSRLERELD